MKTTRSILPTLAFLTGLILLGSPRLHAADVTQYGALKGAKYTQTEAGTPSGDWVFYQLTGFVRMSTAGAVTEAAVTPPDRDEFPLVVQDDPNVLLLELPAALTPAELNAIFPNGDYTLSMTTTHDGNKNVSLSLTGDVYPNTPTFQNFAALGSVNPSAAFALSWSAFTGGTANDVIEVRVMDGADQAFGGTLAGTATSVNIPANTLAAETTYSVTLTFIKVTTRNTTSYPGATGLAGYFKTTSAELTTTAGSGGGDTTPPELVSTVPAGGATGVATSSQIVFLFNEPMAAAQSIAWSANLTPANFLYSWNGDGRSLTCTYSGGLPANAVITWTLNPSGQPQSFKDLAGNPLPENTYVGGFTTGGSTNNPCTSEDDGRGYGGATKHLYFVQTSAAAPVPDPERPATFLGSTTSPTNNPVTAAKLQVPGGPLLTLTNMFGRAFLDMEEYASQSALDTARPAGNYTLQFTRASGSPSASVNLTSSYPPTPEIQNYAACQAVDPTANFTIQWNGFSGATANDSIGISIVDPDPMNFWSWSAPDPCVPRDLPRTATSVTLAANTFKPGKSYEATLTYSRMTDGKTNAIADMTLAAWLIKSVDFTIKTTGGGGGGGARFIGYTRLPGGVLEVNLQGTVGDRFAIEASDNLLGGWITISTQTIPVGGVATFQVTMGAKPGFLRARRL